MTQRDDPTSVPHAMPHSDPSAPRRSRPVGLAVLLTAANMLVAGLVGVITMRCLPPMDASFVTLGVMAVLLTVLVSMLGWWREVGLDGPQKWQNIHLLTLPAVLVLIVPFLHGVKLLALPVILYLAAGYALTGFYEELWARGVLLRVLQPSGQVQAVIVSALLFGALHLGNVLYRDSAVVAAQAVGAFCFGLAYAALRLRTNALWLLMGLHALHDFTLRFSNFPLIGLDVVQDVVLVAFACVLLWGMRRARREERANTSVRVASP